MSTPKRIQRKRTKGWRMPEGAAYVGRPSRYGNPYQVKQSARFAGMEGVWFVERNGKTWIPEEDTQEAARALAVKVFRSNLLGFWNAEMRALLPAELADKDLACWCPLDQPCHADVLLEIANEEQP